MMPLRPNASAAVTFGAERRQINVAQNTNKKRRTNVVYKHALFGRDAKFFEHKLKCDCKHYPNCSRRAHMINFGLRFTHADYARLDESVEFVNLGNKRRSREGAISIKIVCQDADFVAERFELSSCVYNIVVLQMTKTR